MKKLFAVFLLFAAVKGMAQNGAQIPLGGSLGVPGSAPTLCSSHVTLPADANYTLTPAQYACNSLYIDSAVSLTGERTVYAPLNYGQQFTVTNATSGSEPILFEGTSGTGVGIPNGSTEVVTSPNGTSYVTASGGGGGGALNPIGAVYQSNFFGGATFDARLQNCVNALSATFGGVCDARQEPSSTLAANIQISTPNTTVILPCATLTTSHQFVVTAGTRNVVVQGCSYQGGSTANGTEGGSVWVYTGSNAAFQIGDPTYAQDTKGFWMTNVNINTAGGGSGANAIYFYRSQEVRLDSLYLNGDQLTDQIGITLDGTGNYTGGTFIDVVIDGFGSGWYLTGHLSGSVNGDYANASTFIKTHIDCPTNGGSPVSGTYGINVVAGDGNTWSGGDVEGCSTMFHFGSNAINNTVDGLRNENSTIQYQADSGSSYNAVFTGGTFFTGDLIDNGSRNSFWDAFHRTVNGVNGDWYASQKDATIINHLRLGTGTGNVRGMQWESQVDVGTSSSQYNWLWGLTDGASGQSNWIFQDLINNVIRIQLQEYNSPGGANDTAVNAAGTGNVCFNCSGNSGTGGVAFSSGGATPATVGTIDSGGDAQFLGTLIVGGVSTFESSVTVKNQQDAEIDYTLYAGLTTSQKESLVYKDYTGASQWYAEKDASNNWELTSAPGGLDAIKAYQSTNSGDLYLNTAKTGAAIRMNYETGAGSATDIYAGSSSALIASFTATNSVDFPGLASSSQTSLATLDTSGFLHTSNVGISTGTGGPSGSCTEPALYFNTAGTGGGNNNIYVCAGGSWSNIK